MRILLLIGIVSLQYALSAPSFLLPRPSSHRLLDMDNSLSRSGWMEYLMEGENSRPDIQRHPLLRTEGREGRPTAIESQVDLDGDGVLSLAEVQYAAFVHHGLSGSVVQQLFEQVDKDHDGFLTLNEFDNIRPLVLARAENAAGHYMKTIDTDGDGKLSLDEAQKYILKEYGIGSRDVERVWKLVSPSTEQPMDAAQFSKLRRRIRGMTIRLARQIMKTADTNEDGHISLSEAQAIAFEQEGIGAEDVAAMLASVDDNEDGELNAPEFADFERIVRAKAVETSKRALKVVDANGDGALTLDEAKRIAFEHYGFDETVLGPFFAQADENEDGELDGVEFAGFRSVIRSKAVRNAVEAINAVDTDGDGLISLNEAEEKAKKEDDMESPETRALFNIADQNKSGKLDRVEFADFIRLVRLSAIKFANDHFKEFDSNGDGKVTVDELSHLITEKYGIPEEDTMKMFQKVDVDQSGDLMPAEIVDFRHEIRSFVRTRSQEQGVSSPFPTLMPGTTVETSNRSKEIPVETSSVPSTSTAEIPESEQEDSRMMITLRSFKLTPATTTTVPTSTDTSHDDLTTPFETDEREKETSTQPELQSRTTPFIAAVVDEVNEHQEKAESPIPPYSKDDNDYVPDSPIHLDPQDEALEELEAEIDIETQQKKIIDLRRKEQMQKEMEMRNATELPSEVEDPSSTPSDQTFPTEVLRSEDEELKRAEEKMREKGDKTGPPSIRVSLSTRIPESEENEETTTKKTQTDKIDSMEASLARMDSAELRLV